jgi:hypothetical protein
VVVALGLPAPAFAGIYSWSLPTAQAPGPANPDHDDYGAAPWTYAEVQTVTTPGMEPAFELLGTYSAAIQGGLSGWYDAVDTDQPFVAANRTGQPVGVVPAGTLALQPARDRLVAVGWTSPLSSSQQVTVSGTFTAQDSDAACLSRPTWSLEQNGTVLASGGVITGGSSQTISLSPTIDPGQTIYLVVGWMGASYNPACVTAGLTLSLDAPSSPPTVTLDRPTPRARIRGAQPVFAGQASSDFGDSPHVTVKVFKGSSARGTPVERVTATQSGGGYSAPASPPLANGTYTALATQDDQAGDSSSSAPVTFTVHNVAPHVVLLAPGSKPLLSPTPTLRGRAGTARGDSDSVSVGIWPGRVPKGSPFRYLVAKRGGDGSFSVRVTPPLPNGLYSAMAAQLGAGEVTGVSQPVTFRIQVAPPQLIGSIVTLDRSGRAAVPITCTALSGSCTGDVLVLTESSFAPVAGGPSGRVRVLFAHIQIPAGSTALVQRTVPDYVAAALRRHAPLPVSVTVTMTDSAGHQVGGSAVRTLRLGTPQPAKHG